jgi:hypothetical protein
MYRNNLTRPLKSPPFLFPFSLLKLLLQPPSASLSRCCIGFLSASNNQMCLLPRHLLFRPFHSLSCLRRIPLHCFCQIIAPEHMDGDGRYTVSHGQRTGLGHTGRTPKNVAFCILLITFHLEGWITALPHRKNTEHHLLFAPSKPPPPPLSLIIPFFPSVALYYV